MNQKGRINVSKRICISFAAFGSRTKKMSKSQSWAKKTLGGRGGLSAGANDSQVTKVAHGIKRHGGGLTKNRVTRHTVDRRRREPQIKL